MDQLDSLRTHLDDSPKSEAIRRVIDGAERWAAVKGVPLEETPQWPSIQHAAKMLGVDAETPRHLG